MSLTNTPSGERIHIAFFGKRNAGKSSLVNAVTGQNLSIVSEIAGTTTDPVRKTMELLPLGPVVIIDTPGYDDEGLLGEKRIGKTREILAKTDIAVLTIDGTRGLSKEDAEFLKLLKEKGLPHLIVCTKSDIADNEAESVPKDAVLTSAVKGEGIRELKERLAGLLNEKRQEKYILADLIQAGDIVVLVTPIDASAPKGRLILPQQQTLREILDLHGLAVVCQTEELGSTLAALGRKPKLVITDSQDFERVGKIVPQEIPLTSFSILFARYKGNLDALLSGVKALEGLKDGDRVLISEGCTHHRQCEDIGTKKIPNWIERYTGVKPQYRFTSGGEFPQDLTEYALIVHCGGCMLNEKEMQSRIQRAVSAGVPIINYGALIAKLHGLLDRSLEPVR